MSPSQETARRLASDELAARGRLAGWPESSLTHDGERWIARLSDGQSGIDAPHESPVVAVETALLIAGAQ